MDRGSDMMFHRSDDRSPAVVMLLCRPAVPSAERQDDSTARRPFHPREVTVSFKPVSFKPVAD
jgi:hypothetical protein